jgi:glutaredoxin 3
MRATFARGSLKPGGANVQETIVYTKPGCPYCAAAMADLNARGVAFKQIDAQANASARAEMRRLSGRLNVPTIVHPDGTVTVGFDGY